MKDKLKIRLADRRVMAGLWVLIGVLSALTKLHPDRHNNFNIFRYVFYNTWEGTSLYAESTDGGFWDLNHYGPFFSVIISPFALVPDWLGLVLWCTALASFLCWAIFRFCNIPNPDGKKDTMLPFLIWFCAHELLTALFMQQFNVAIAAIILLSYYFVEKERDEWATFFIVIGTLVKLYGIVGLAFFFFSRHKVKYVISLLGWTIVLGCLPMLISSPYYQLEQYQEWFTSLGEKNGDNSLAFAQNISLLGMVRKAWFALSGGYTYQGAWVGATPPTYSDLPLIGMGCLAMATGYFRIRQWGNQLFRQQVLAGVLMFVCLFSTGTESSGYIIALTGCCIWYVRVPWTRSKWDTALMVFAFVVTSCSPSDLFPAYVRSELIQPYALKALPVCLIWFKLVYELIRKDYAVCTR